MDVQMTKTDQQAEFNDYFNNLNWCGKPLPELTLEELQGFVSAYLQSKVKFQLAEESHELKKLRIENNLLREIINGRR